MWELRQMKLDIEPHEAMRLNMTAWTGYWALRGEPGCVLRALQDVQCHLFPVLMRAMRPGDPEGMKVVRLALKNGGV